MCGLAGFLEHPPRSRHDALIATVTGMAATLRHRGPDAGGAWAEPSAGVAFGFRRLAIVDLSPAGDQPMTSGDGRFVMVYNGEVYNFAELRVELEASGHRFRGRSDTEVILEGFSEWGIGATVGRLIGMFAFAVWDRGEHTLTLGRDRLGIKPLYWTETGGVLLFGSELKALRAHPAGRGFELDRGALAAYLRLMYVPAPWSIWRGVQKLEPGTLLTVASGAEPRVERYWDAGEVARRGVRDRFAGSEEEAADELELLLGDAVQRRMIADVPLGALLSGGIDSSLVVALMQAASPRPVKTFTIGFGDARYDEVRYAREVARRLGTEHTELYVESSHALALIPRLPEWFDEPFGDSSQVPTYLVSELARRHVTVALTGDGADEVFGGYGRYVWSDRVTRGANSWRRPFQAVLASALGVVPDALWDDAFSWLPGRLRPRPLRDRARKFRDVLAAAARDSDAAYRRMITWWTAPEAVVLGAREATGPWLQGGIPEELSDPVERMQLLDILTYLPGDILCKVDRASMAVSLEARVPLLDHRVVEFAWRLPPAMKLAHGGGTKRVLRRILGRHLPSELFERPKMGFSVPLDAWLRGPLREWAEALLAEDRLRAEGIFDARLVRERWTGHLSGRRSGEHQLWCVLMFQAWWEHERG